MDKVKPRQMVFDKSEGPSETIATIHLDGQLVGYVKDGTCVITEKGSGLDAEEVLRCFQASTVLDLRDGSAVAHSGGAQSRAIRFQHDLDEVRKKLREENRLRWDGEKIRPIRAEQKTPRNTPCPCGSGKKFKACCLTREALAR